MVINDNQWYIPDICPDLRFVKKVTGPDFRAKKFYTLKVRKLRLFLLKKKQHKCIDISNLSDFLLKFNWVCKILTAAYKITLGVCKSCSSMQIMQEIALFSGKIYTAGTNFTRPPVVTVATNLNSASQVFLLARKIAKNTSTMQWLEIIIGPFLVAIVRHHTKSQQR